MRILLVNTGIFPVPPKRGGGIETHTYNLARALAELGCKVYYVTDITNEARFSKNVTIFRTYAPRMKFQAGFHEWVFNHGIGGVLSFRASLLALIRKRFDFDVVHVHGNLSGLLISMVNQRSPLVFTVHNPTPWMCTYKSPYEQMFREVAYGLIDANVMRNVDHVIAVSSSLRDDVVSRWGIPIEKITVVPSGVDTDIFCPATPEVSYIKAKYHIDSRYCLFVGQLRSRKGVDYLLRAFSNQGDKRIRCVVVGDGPERRKLFEMAEDLGLGDRVIFTGAVPFEDLLKLYSEAEFFILPTLAEGLPLVILEAFASGLPVISTNVGGIPEIVEDGHNGFIVPPRDVVALSECIKVLAENQKLRKKMGETARGKAVERFAWRAVARKTLSVYEKAIEEKLC